MTTVTASWTKTSRRSARSVPQVSASASVPAPWCATLPATVLNVPPLRAPQWRNCATVWTTTATPCSTRISRIWARSALPAPANASHLVSMNAVLTVPTPSATPSRELPLPTSAMNRTTTATVLSMKISSTRGVFVLSVSASVSLTVSGCALAMEQGLSVTACRERRLSNPVTDWTTTVMARSTKTGPRRTRFALSVLAPARIPVSSDAAPTCQGLNAA